MKKKIKRKIIVDRGLFIANVLGNIEELFWQEKFACRPSRFQKKCPCVLWRDILGGDAIEKRMTCRGR